jgi:hypothetical protein
MDKQQALQFRPDTFEIRCVACIPQQTSTLLLTITLKRSS